MTASAPTDPTGDAPEPTLKLRAVVLLSGLLISATGRLINTTALPLLVLDRFESDLSVGVVLAARVVPRLVLGPIAGVLADRLPRRAILATTNLATAALVGLIPFTVSLPQLYLLAILIGTLDAAAQPASFSLLPDVFPKAHLARINTLAEGLYTVAMLSGPLIAVGLVARLGLDAAFFVDAASFLVATATLAVMRPRYALRRRRADAAATPGRRIWRLVSRDPMLRLLLPVNATYGLGLGTLQPIYPVLAIEALDAGEAGYGALLTAVGVGALIGIALSPWLGPRAAPPLTLGLLAASGFLLATVAAAPTIWVAVAILTVALIPESVAHVRLTIEAQRRVPGELLGRYHGTAMTVVSGSRPAGNLLGGTLLALTGPTWAVVVVGGVWITAPLVLSTVLRRGAEAIDPNDPSDRLGTAGTGTPSVSSD